ncbi:sigma-70 family RNA polymerase sigma factor [Streptomyces phaeochromogenes]|uniref:sigma-70 family RNA polymerase sigma factor n=1 Tax=Streptomyces phaeochromogenes TaxID=1923 RepID=UPI0006E323AC|nr:sigma-70 family RNA polymerase sigma factor [Streptomyces phaeochromogenes]
MNATIEEQFADIYRNYYGQLVLWLRYRLPASLSSQAEDFAQEACVSLLQYLRKGKSVQAPGGLLRKMAQRRVWEQQALHSSQHSFVTDLNDPASVALDGLKAHRYAAGDPMLAMIAAELETAHERMEEASQRWRALHRKVSSLRPRGAPSTDPARVARTEARIVDARLQRDEALVELQEACRVVGQLRGELECAGGGSWRSCSGWPPARYMGGKRLDGVASDPTAKHCSFGHRLDDLERVSFLADGTRTCRDCSNAKGSKKSASLTPSI